MPEKKSESGIREAAIYMVSVWAQQNQLVLGQQKVDDKSNEITAIPKLLTQLDIAAAVITTKIAIRLSSKVRIMS